MKAEIFFDMDQVLCDFYGAVEPHVGEIDKTIDFSEDAIRLRKKRKAIINNMVYNMDLFANLDPLPDYQKMRDFATGLVMDGYLVRCLTSTGGFDHGEVIKQKLHWINTHRFPNYGVVFVHKGKFKAEMAHEHSLLIDDFELNTNLFSKRGGHAITHINAQTTIDEFYNKVLPKLEKK